MCSQFRWVNQILFFVIAHWIQSALHLSCAANLCALLEGEFCCQLKIIWTVALGQKVFELERRSPFSQNLPSHYALVVPFPPHWVASVQECLTEEFLHHLILRETASISSIPWPFPIESHDELVPEDLAGRAVTPHSLCSGCCWGSYKLQLSGMTQFDFMCWEKNSCEILWKTLRNFFFPRPFFLLHLASGKECKQVACMIIKCQIWNYLLVPGKPQVSKEKEKSEFTCKAELHWRAADLLSIKCQYQYNKDGTQSMMRTLLKKNPFQ